MSPASMWAFGHCRAQPFQWGPDPVPAPNPQLSILGTLNKHTTAIAKKERPGPVPPSLGRGTSPRAVFTHCGHDHHENSGPQNAVKQRK